MHAYNRLPGSGHNSPSPPASPLRSPRLRHSRSKPGRFTQPPITLPQRLAWIVLSLLLRRQGIFLFAPLLYISGMLFYMGTVSFDSVPVIKHRPPPGSVYRSPQLYAKLRPEMDADNSSLDAVSHSISSPFHALFKNLFFTIIIMCTATKTKPTILLHFDLKPGGLIIIDCGIKLVTFLIVRD